PQLHGTDGGHPGDQRGPGRAEDRASLELAVVAQISYRAARLEDAALAADLMTAGFPREPEDPILTRYRWEHPRGGWSIHRFIGSVDGSDIAYLSSAHSEGSKNPEHHGWLEGYFDEARMDRSAAKEMWQGIGERRGGGVGLHAHTAAR